MVSLTTSLSRRCIKDASKKVKKKKMQLMMPRAKEALSKAHVLLTLMDIGVALMLSGEIVTVPPELLTPPELLRPPEADEQLAFAIPRSSYTPAIKAPTKQRSIKATKCADRRVESRRTRVTSAQAAARTETMNSTLYFVLAYITTISVERRGLLTVYNWE